MSKNEDKTKFESVGRLTVEGQFLRLSFYGSDGKTFDASKESFCFTIDVLALAAGLRDNPDVRVYKWRDMKAAPSI